MAASENIEVRIYYQWLDAQVLRRAGKLEEALAEAETVAAARDRLGLTHGNVKVGLVLAVEIALDLDDEAKAETLLQIVRDARPGQVTPWLRAHTARLAARVSALHGEDDEVDEGFWAAERGLRDVGARFEVAVTLLEHSEWLVRDGRSDEASPLLAEAREIFEGLQARPGLERVAKVDGGVGEPAVVESRP